MSKKKINGVSASFTYQYPNWDNQFVKAIFDHNEKQQKIETQNTIAWMDFIEQEIQEMDSYPEAEAIIQNLTGVDDGE